MLKDLKIFGASNVWSSKCSLPARKGVLKV